MTTNQEQQPESADKEKIKRPLLVWIIFVYATFSLTDLIGYYLIVSGDAVADGLAGEYYKTLNSVDHVFNVFTPLYFYICGLQLFRLKAVALNLFLGYIPIMAAVQTNNLFSPTWRALIEAQPLAYYSIAINFLLYFAYAYYAFILIRKGILK